MFLPRYSYFQMMSLLRGKSGPSSEKGTTAFRF